MVAAAVVDVFDVGAALAMAAGVIIASPLGDSWPSFTFIGVVVLALVAALVGVFPQLWPSLSLPL